MTIWRGEGGGGDATTDSEINFITSLTNSITADTALTSANAAATAALYDSFDDRYLGSKAAAPTLDNDGNVLIEGALYWNSVSYQMFVWSGVAWQQTFFSGTNVRSVVTATAGQTVVTVPTYTLSTNTIQVYVNGFKVISGTDYAETNTTSITFASGLTLGDEVEILIAQPFSIGTTSAEAVSYIPSGTLSSLTAQTAIDELASEKVQSTVLAASSGSSLVGYLPSGTGAAATTVQTKLRESVSVKDFGADPTGGVDSTTAIQAAINATVYAGTLHIPSGVYLVSAGLTATQPIRIVGDGLSSVIYVAASVSATTDVITFVGTSSGAAAEGYYISDIKIIPVSGTPARYGVNLGSQTATGINRSTVERVYIGQFGSYGLRNNGSFSSTVQNSSITGLLFDLCTDNQNVLNNTLRGNDWGIYINTVPGTNLFNIEGNVIVSKLGGVNAIDCGSLNITNNQFETQQNTTDPDYSQVVLKGTLRYISNTQITGNNFNTSFNFISAVKLKRTIDAHIYGNEFFCGTFPTASQKCIDIESTAFGTILHNNSMIGASGLPDYSLVQRTMATEYDATYNPNSFIFDAGVGTCGVWKFMKWINFPTISATNYYSAAGGANCLPTPSNFPLAKYRKSADGFRVEFAGGMTLGDKSDGKLIFTMPVGFRPVQSETFADAISATPITGFVGGGSTYQMAIRVTPSAGNMVISGGNGLAVTPGFITLDGASYQVTYP